jgi:hypothetical protein
MTDDPILVAIRQIVREEIQAEAARANRYSSSCRAQQIKVAAQKLADSYIEKHERMKLMGQIK